MGEKSTLPIGGTTARIGFNAGSVALLSNRITQCSVGNRNHDAITAAKTTSE
jgi:hypothetical protein